MTTMHLQDDLVSSQALETTFRKRTIFALPLLLGLVLLLAMSATTSRHSDSLFDRSLTFKEPPVVEPPPPVVEPPAPFCPARSTGLCFGSISCSYDYKLVPEAFNGVCTGNTYCEAERICDCSEGILRCALQNFGSQNCGSNGPVFSPELLSSCEPCPASFSDPCVGSISCDYDYKLLPEASEGVCTGNTYCEAERVCKCSEGILRCALQNFGFANCGDNGPVFSPPLLSSCEP
jgi:hypothetical protein